VQARDGHRQLESSWTGGSRVQVEHSIAHFFARLMRMTADNGVEGGRWGLKVVDIVQDE
jgi:hypothetical protein